MENYIEEEDYFENNYFEDEDFFKVCGDERRRCTGRSL